MSWTEFWIVFGICVAAIFVCRVAPMLLLKGRDLPEELVKALRLIPPATFAALVANDTISPDIFLNLWPGCAILVAALCVVPVAIKTKSLLWSAIGGVISYSILLYWEIPFSVLQQFFVAL